LAPQNTQCVTGGGHELTLTVTFEFNKAPRRKQLGIKGAFQTAGFQPAFAPREQRIQPEDIQDGFCGLSQLRRAFCFVPSLCCASRQIVPKKRRSIDKKPRC